MDKAISEEELAATVADANAWNARQYRLRTHAPQMSDADRQELSAIMARAQAFASKTGADAGADVLEWLNAALNTKPARQSTPSPRVGSPGVEEAARRVLSAICRHHPVLDADAVWGNPHAPERAEAMDAAREILAGPEGGWQPIETAPKDGRVIVAWCIHRNALYSDDPVGEGWAAPVHAKWIDHNGGGWTWDGLAGVFTHWLAHAPTDYLDRARAIYVRPHKFEASKIGHGEAQCSYCHATNRELAALGELEHCDSAPLPSPPEGAES